MSSGEIAKVLEDNHIVKDRQEFAQYLIAHNDQAKIQLGTYNLTSSMNYNQIAKIITKTM